MKTQSLLLSFLCLFIFNNISFRQSAKKESIKVWGNCEMCKKKIETAAKQAGATSASWNTETKMLAVAYPAKKTNAEKIQQAIAAAGYDTKDLTASDEAYNKLHACCQYDRKTDESSNTAKKDACCTEEKCSKEAKEVCKDKECCKSKDCCKS